MGDNVGMGEVGVVESGRLEGQSAPDLDQTVILGGGGQEGGRGGEDGVRDGRAKN